MYPISADDLAYGIKLVAIDGYDQIMGVVYQLSALLLVRQTQFLKV